ncbi:MAG: TlpA family protein disulfide reductase [Myxococcales bacterium]|nr:TlpA family protein disulfide reductase [Myxococcales bacterium]
MAVRAPGGLDAARLAGSVAVVLALASACVRAEPEPRAPVEVEERGTEPVAPFVFDSLDARPVARDALRGKPAVLVFVTTWDIASQAQVGFLVHMAARDGDAVTYALVALHERHERELVEAYARTLKVTFPVALGDADSRVGRGPLGDVHQIPTVLVLDAAGRLVKRHVGLTKSDALRASVELAKRAPAPTGR